MSPGAQSLGLLVRVTVRKTSHILQRTLPQQGFRHAGLSHFMEKIRHSQPVAIARRPPIGRAASLTGKGLGIITACNLTAARAP